jgi:glycosyltransferase involved in cell wall biosynthesis
MTAAPLARRLRPGVACVLDAHNVDHRLLERQMSGDSARPPSPQQSAVVDRVRRLERSLDHHVDAVWACSEDDRQEFQAHNDLPVCTSPNGVDCRAKPFDPGPTKSEGREILFCGSLTYGPNSQGLIWFLKNIWPEIRRRVPKVLLTIVGRDGSAEQFQEHLVDSSISFVGEVLDLEPYYRRASLSVCPLLMGSGTRLKILEAMSFGVPVVSTRIGAEGIGAAGGQHLLLADTPADFAEAIDRLLTDATLYELVRLAARRLVEEHYDWDVIGESARRSLEEILRNKDN